MASFLIQTSKQNEKKHTLFNACSLINNDTFNDIIPFRIKDAQSVQLYSCTLGKGILNEERCKKIYTEQSDLENIKNVYKTEFCYENKNEIYSIGNEIGKGKSNIVFIIENDNTKVYRELKENKIDKVNKYQELNGLYLQWFLSTQCKNICKVFDFGFKGDDINFTDNTTNIYAIIEKLTPIGKFIRDKKTSFLLSYDQIIKILYEILKGLKCIHSNHFIHNDINENNIGIELTKNIEDIKVKIYDFGLSQYLNNQSFVYIPEYIINDSNYRDNIDRDHIDPFIRWYGLFSKYSDIYGYGYLAYTLFFFYFHFNKQTDAEKKNEIISLINSCIYPLKCNEKLFYGESPSYIKMIENVREEITTNMDLHKSVMSQIKENNELKDNNTKIIKNKNIINTVFYRPLITFLSTKRSSAKKLLKSPIFDKIRKEDKQIQSSKGGKTKRTYKRRKNSRIKSSKRFK